MHQLLPDDPCSEPSGNSMPLAEMVTRACKKDSQAFEILYKYYLKPLTGFLWKLVNNKETANDIYQETFLSVWKCIQKGSISQDIVEHFKPWLYKVALSRAADYYRRTGKFEIYPLPQA